MIVRRYQDADFEAVVTLFTDTVRNVNCRDYSPEQIATWAPHPPDFVHWRDRIAGVTLWVAELDSRTIGFCGLGIDGHIDLLYSDRQFQRQGVARRLYEQVEGQALQGGVRRLFTEASITARPFFEGIGFCTVREQQVNFRGVIFQNYAMEKHLAGG